MIPLLCLVILTLVFVLIAFTLAVWQTEAELHAQVDGRDGRIRQLERELLDITARHARDLQRLKRPLYLQVPRDAAFLPSDTRVVRIFDLCNRMN